MTTTDPIKQACEKVREAQRTRLEDLLRDCAELLEKYEDVIDGDDGRPRANRAMALRAQILAELAE